MVYIFSVAKHFDLNLWQEISGSCLGLNLIKEEIFSSSLNLKYWGTDSSTPSKTKDKIIT